MSGPDLSDYIEVPDRIRDFITKHPDGSLQTVKVEYRDLPAAHKNGEPCPHVIYHAAAYRTPDDKRPGHGMASEPLPGLTPYTKGSELMNAETSAWGRALVALGFVGKKVASANEVRARQGGDKTANGRAGRPTDKQKQLIEKLVKSKGLSLEDLALVVKDATGTEVTIKDGWMDLLSGGKEGSASALIDRLMNGTFPVRTGVSDVPSDPDEFSHPPVGSGDPIFEEAS